MQNEAFPKIVDLFCGCSGFGLGATQAGFDVTVSADVDAILSSSHHINFPRGKLLLRDVATLGGNEIRNAAGGIVDGIIGGPPCQGFSSIGKRDPNDPRRELVYHFFRVVDEVRPAFFAMENVKGILFDNNKKVLEASLELVASKYEIVGPIVLDAAQFGAATKRPRVFVIGYDRQRFQPFTAEDILQSSVGPATVREALKDLEGAQLRERDGEWDAWSYAPERLPAEYAVRLRSPTGRFTGHRKTPHRPEIVDRFSRVEPGGIDKVGRHPRLDWNGQCPTLRAGTGADRGSYQAVRPLHPSENRVITVREAARLQGFPDDFVFHPTVWHSFRMIGNSVSPVIARHIMAFIKARMEVDQPLQALG